MRGDQAKRATQLFQDEVTSLSQAVTGWEKKIAQFKVDHIGELPEQLEMNMRGLERVGALLQTKSRGAARRRDPPLGPGPGSQRRGQRGRPPRGRREQTSPRTWSPPSPPGRETTPR